MKVARAISVTPDKIVIFLIDELAKACLPMDVRVEGREMPCNLEQSANEHSPITARPSGRVTFSSSLQFSNAPSPITVTPDGLVIFLIAVHQKASSPMDVRVEGRLTPKRNN